MNRVIALAVIALALMPAAALAQAPQPYAGQETRPIKALSEQQVADLRAGRGMGLALAAELNGYPGPLHVVELAAALELSDAQRAKAQALFEAMKAETVPLGERLIAEEAALDRLFAAKTVTEASLTAAMQAIGSTQALLRAAHLKYHLAMAAALTPAQVTRYAALRGYSGAARPGHPHDAHRH